MIRGVLIFVLTMLSAGAVRAQESRIASDIRREKEQVVGSCNSFELKPLGGCVYTLMTGSPVHIAAGSLAPQSGFAFGLAFAERFTPNESWRLTWSADAVTTLAGSWRAGAYAKFIRTPATPGVVVRPAGPAVGAVTITPRPVPVFDLFVQSIALEALSYYGIGMDTLRANRSIFRENQTILGGSVLYPIDARGIALLRPSLVGGIQFRWIDIGNGTSDTFPGIEDRFSEASAPGLTDQDAFTQFTEGIRLKPSLANGAVAMNYLFSSQQFRTSGDSHGSFVRWTADLRHEFQLYRRVPSAAPRDFNSPNDCAAAAGSSACPPVQWSRNREGTVTIRGLVIGASSGETEHVPFYLQPTLGGSDLNGERLVAGYDDYRFRGPNLVAVQESVEHSIWGPLGGFLMLEQGTVAERFGQLTLRNVAHSATVGLTLRAGGFPMVQLSFAFGGEGHHIIAAMDSSLLGGSRRPSLY